MGSQTDLDQGGTFREWVKTYLGPSVGWVYLPGSNVLPITAAGSYTLALGMSVVLVNIAGLVTLFLPTTIHPTVPAGVLPVPYADTQITVVDIGGHAKATPITIKPASVAEAIMNLAQIQITANYGSFILRPNSTLHGWTA